MLFSCTSDRHLAGWSGWMASPMWRGWKAWRKDLRWLLSCGWSPGEPGFGVKVWINLILIVGESPIENPRNGWFIYIFLPALQSWLVNGGVYCIWFTIWYVNIAVSRRDHTGSLSPNGHFEHEDSPEDLGVPFFRQNHINIFHFVSLLLESDMILESDMVEPNDIDTT